MKKLLVVVVCLQVALLSAYLWQRSLAEAERGAGAGLPTPGGNGDVNGDGERDISDAIYLLSFLFSGGEAPVACAQEAGLDPVVESLRVAAPDGSGLVSFGNNPDNLCAIGIAPPGGPGGLLLRDPAGTRILAPGTTTGGPRLLFGPTDDCSIGIDPTGRMPGLIERDPIGFRLLGQNEQGCRLIFGPTMDCTIEVNPQGLMGLLLRDPKGIRILGGAGAAGGAPTLRFGPTDDCSIGIDPVLTGLIERDPVGLRLLGRNSQGCRLLFGPTDDCTIAVEPEGPMGLLLRDPKGIRLLGVPTPDGTTTLPVLRFGPTDDCSIGIDPAFPGLVERDPIGFRLLGQNNQGCRLLFGPTDDCSVMVDPAGPAGLLLRDPRGIRILPPQGLPGQQPSPAQLLFGPTDDCSIGVIPGRQGLQLHDPAGFFFEGGPIFASQFIQTSSRRFKRDVQPIEDPLAKVQALKGVTFQWDEAHGGRQDIGFIAEDVAEVLPEVVQRDESSKAAIGVSYGQVVAVAVEGIKAQQQEIDELRSQNAALEKELSDLKAQMALIAAKVNGLTVAPAGR